LSAVAPSHIRELLTVRPDGQPAVNRVRRGTAARIARTTVAAADPSIRAQVPARGTVRRLQALHAVGWSTSQLAARLGRNPQILRRTMAGERVTVGTQSAVSALYEQLWDARPDVFGGPARVIAESARAESRRRGWAPPLAWDDIDADREPPSAPPDPRHVDEIAVERALARDGITLGDLNSAEQAIVISALSGRGHSLSDIADALTTTARTVSRRRAALRAAS
jgi:hypothetical protein